MKPLFRPVSFWQSALMTLPDAAFFDLMRSILGTVKTPFNKQNLVEELSRFVARPEIQETMAAYINEDDRRLIAAIALLSEPVPGELESFFTGEYSYAKLQGILLNLEERLIIYRFRDDNNLRIALNPRLEQVLAPHAANSGILFSSTITGKPEPVESGALNERSLAALFSFLLNSEVQVKEDSRTGKEMVFVFRKKVAEQGKTLFPGLDIDVVTGGLLVLGLLVQKEESIMPDEARLNEYKALSAKTRLVYLAGAIAVFLHRGGAFSPYQNRTVLRKTTQMIHSLNNAAKNDSVFPEATIIKLIELFRRQEDSGMAETGLGWGFSGELPSTANLLQALVMTGLFSIGKIDDIICYCPVILPQTTPEASAAKPLIAMDSGFSCVLYPEIRFADALDLAAFSVVEETGTTVRFTLSRDSVVRGFDRGYAAEFLWKLLDRLAGGRTPDTLKWNLDDWEKRWQEVSLNQGVILTLGSERDYLAQTGPLSLMIRRSLAPGIYLLSAEIDEAAAALRSAGVDIVARPKLSGSSSSFFSSLGEIDMSSKGLTEKAGDAASAGTVSAKEESAEDNTEDNAEENAEQIKEKFRLALKNMKLTKQEQEELESRIERRVVVSETQLKDPSLRYEKLEARSMDYVGKTSIVRQAMTTGSLLELSCLSGETFLGIPESLDKKGTEMILTIKPREGGDPVKLTLGKISIVRRIKQSIFGV